MDAVAARSISAEGMTLTAAGTLSIGSSLPATGDILTSTLPTGAGGDGGAATGPADGDGVWTGAGTAGGGVATGSVLAGAGEAFFFGALLGATTSIFGKTGAVTAGAGVSGV